MVLIHLLAGGNLDNNAEKQNCSINISVQYLGKSQMTPDRKMMKCSPF